MAEGKARVVGRAESKFAGERLRINLLTVLIQQPHLNLVCCTSFGGGSVDDEGKTKLRDRDRCVRRRNGREHSHDRELATRVDLRVIGKERAIDVHSMSRLQEEVRAPRRIRSGALEKAGPAGHRSRSFSRLNASAGIRNGCIPRQDDTHRAEATRDVVNLRSCANLLPTLMR